MGPVRIIKLNVTEKCFFRCMTCHAWMNGKEFVPDKGKLSSFFKGISRIKGKETSVNFTGGEPLLEPSIFDLIRMGTDAGIYTHLNTNGWMVDLPTARKLSSAGLSDISISLDSADWKIHDQLRGMPGSYDRVMLALKALSEEAPLTKVHLIATISSYSLERIPDLVRMADNDGRIKSIVINSVTPTLFSGNSDKEFYNSSPWPGNKEKVRGVYSRLIQMKRQGSKISNPEERLKIQYLYFTNPHFRQDLTCSVGQDLHINNAGQISHCHVLQDVIGSLDQSPEDIWKSKASDESRSRIMDCRRNCHELLNCGVFRG
jgi:MoaA/NifB/PqqE/SkfB family radical SAM enzyme